MWKQVDLPTETPAVSTQNRKSRWRSPPVRWGNFPRAKALGEIPDRTLTQKRRESEEQSCGVFVSGSVFPSTVINMAELEFHSFTSSQFFQGSSWIFQFSEKLLHAKEQQSVQFTATWWSRLGRGLSAGMVPTTAWRVVYLD